MSKSKPPKPDRADAHVLEAERCLARGNPAAAEMAATLALAMKPRHSRALLALARVDRTRAQLERAQQNLELALESSPEDREIRRELATVLAARGRRAEAIAMLSDPPPEDAEGWFALGCQHDADGDAERAMIAARKALALAPEHAGALLLAARCHSAVGDIDAAANAYVDAALFALSEQREDRLPALVQRARVLADAPLLPEARRNAILQRIDGAPRLAALGRMN